MPGLEPRGRLLTGQHTNRSATQYDTSTNILEGEVEGLGADDPCDDLKYIYFFTIFFRLKIV